MYSESSWEVNPNSSFTPVPVSSIELNPEAKPEFSIVVRCQRYSAAIITKGIFLSQLIWIHREDGKTRRGSINPYPYNYFIILMLYLIKASFRVEKSGGMWYSS